MHANMMINGNYNNSVRKEIAKAQKINKKHVKYNKNKYKNNLNTRLTKITFVLERINQGSFII